MADEQRSDDLTTPDEPAPEGNARVTRMGSGSIPALIAEFAIPSIVGMLVNGAYNLISSIFLGQALGELGLATATAANPTMILFLALSMLVGMGGNALCALRLGEGKHDEAERVLGNTVTLGLMIWMVVLFIAWCPFTLDLLLTLSSVTPEVRPYAELFIRVLSTGFALQMVGMGVNNFIRTAGAPLRALLTMVIGAVSCTAFSFLFVMVLDWGVFGSGLATVCGQAISCASVLWYFIFTKKSPLKLRGRNLRPSVPVMTKILQLGLASFAVQVAASIVNVVTNYVLATYGAIHPMGAQNALASIGVVQRIAMFAVLPVIGVSAAIQPLLGFNYGARLIPRVRTTFLMGVATGMGLATFLWALIMLFPNQLVELFGITDTALRDFTVFALQVQVALLPLCGFQIVGSNYFQATGQPLKSTILSLSRQVIFLVPLLVIMPAVLPGMVPSLTGLDAVYFATPIADGLAILVTFVVVLRELGRLRKIERGEIQVVI
ncbi:MAG: MATE family efflux transporter [Coriobacteriia bacterium]|nr:MATE family efflux transporter [Coriobacteriia bacterium]